MPKKANVGPRLCFLLESFLPTPGGLELHAYQLAERLISKGVELFVLTLQDEHTSAELERVGNVLVRRIPSPGPLKGKVWKALAFIPLIYVKTFYLLIRYLNRYDMIVVSGSKIFSIPAMLVSIFGQKKCIIKAESPMELWEDIPTESLRRMNLSLPQKLLRSILLKLSWIIRNSLIKRANCFVSISSEIRRELISLKVDPQKIRPIPNGIDLDKFSSVSVDEKLRIRQKLSLPTDKVVFTFTGRLAASKGLPLLVEIWKELVKKYQHIHLVLVGSGKGSFDSCEDELRDYIKVSKLERSVSLTGEVDNVYDYLQASNVFVFPSEYEGFGLSIVEALACGLPTVTTRVGVAIELIENYKNGILVNPKDQEGMQTAMEWLLDHKSLWADIGTNARKSMVEKYSMEVVAEKYLEMFMGLQRSEKG